MHNNRNTYCTIITADYYPYAQALLASLQKHSSAPVCLEVFVSDQEADLSFFSKIEKDNLRFNYVKEQDSSMAKKLFEKYNASNMDAYRWSMKSVFINYLLERKGYSKVIFLDCDLFFYNDPQFLFGLLDESRILLSPHWRCADHPEKDFDNFRLNFKDGIYNGGFIGVNKDGIEVMNFWANLCLAACEVNCPEGFFVDQKYLDILQSRFEGIGVLRHRGCNVSNWNITDCQRVLGENGEVLINGTYPIVFIHFTATMIKGILSGEDSKLLPYLKTYSGILSSFNPDIDIIRKYSKILEENKSQNKATLFQRAIAVIKNCFK